MHRLPRRIAVWTHPSRPAAIEAACRFLEALPAGFIALVPAESRSLLAQGVPTMTFVDLTDQVIDQAEVVVVFGGDGTILRAAEQALHQDVPVLGVNLGHVGFLAELEVSQIPELVAHVVAGDYVLERRMTVLVEHFLAGQSQPVWSSVAINEVSLEKASRVKMIDALVSIDGLPVSRWACDGLLVSTPTGSTAYAFSAGGPIMWPELEAFQVVPLAAHALFARPMVLSPKSVVDLLLAGQVDGFVCCDGARSTDTPADSHLRVSRYQHDLLVARLSEQPFTSRLVKKFALPVDGWRHTDMGSVDA